MQQMLRIIIISNYRSVRDPMGWIFRKGFMKEVKFKLSTFSIIIEERGRPFYQNRSV